jgi:hypothetical protein
LTETVTPGVTGFLHAPGDAAALADDVERIEALGPQGRGAMGQEGRRWLLTHANPDQWLDRFAGILGEAIDGKTTVPA